MVAIATPVLGGVRTPSLARPMLLSANTAFLRGSRIEAAVRLREALRRHLAAECRLYRLDDDGNPAELLDRLSGVGSCDRCFVRGLLAEIDDVLTLVDDGRYLDSSIELAFELLDSREDVR